MKLVNNYLNSLESYLPDEMKQEIRQELEASIYGEIEDKQQQLGRDLNENEQETLLKKFGHPMKLAATYLPNQELVSKYYFPAFKTTLEIVLLVSIGIKFLITAPHIFTSGDVIGSAIGFFWGAIETAVWVFGWVTMTFYFLQSNKINIDEIYAWSPKEINFNHPRISIKRLDVFFELVMEVIFVAWWNDVIEWPSELYNEGLSSSFSFSTEWSSVFLAVNIVMALSIALSLYKLIIAGWNKSSLIGNILLNIATFGVIIKITLFEQFVFINDQFNNPEVWGSQMTILDNVTYSILGFIAVFIIWDSYSNIKKLRQR